jgi:hypothetical protein
MERRHQPVARTKPRGDNKDAAGKDSADDPLHLPNIAELITNGEITVGVIRSVGCLHPIQIWYKAAAPAIPASAPYLPTKSGISVLR